MPPADLDRIRTAVRDIPDFPKKGIVFKDITPLLADAQLFARTLELMAEPWRGHGVTKVVGIESRGFIFAAPIALSLGAGLVIARKPGKLPYKTLVEEYALEYGIDTLCLHEDAILPGEKVLVVDDVLATGGTAAAVGRLSTRTGGELLGFCFLIELGFLDGVKKLDGKRAQALLRY